MSEDDRALMERLAALEAEVKADAEAKAERKEVALVKLREQKAEREAERSLEIERSPRARSRKTELEDLGGALELASKANGVRQELTKAPKKGDKSWVKSSLASLLFGPLGWLYAGSLREAVPASAGYVILGTLAAKILPMVLLMPVMLVALPLSGLAGLMYALQYNRAGKRTRLFGDADKKPKLLP